MLSLFPPIPTGRAFSTVAPLETCFAISRIFEVDSIMDSSPVFLSFGVNRITLASDSTWEIGLSPSNDSSPSSWLRVLLLFTICASSSMAICRVSSTIVTDALSTIFDARVYPSVVRPYIATLVFCIGANSAPV